MVILISYKLARPGQDYPDLYDAIKKISGIWWHHTTSCWVIETSLSPKQVFERLNPLIDRNDDLIIFRLQEEWWGQLTELDNLTWLKARNF